MSVQEWELYFFSVLPLHPDEDKGHVQAQYEPRAFTVMLKQCLTIVHICHFSSVSISPILLNSDNNTEQKCRVNIIYILYRSKREMQRG